MTLRIYCSIALLVAPALLPAQERSTPRSRPTIVSPKPARPPRADSLSWSKTWDDLSGLEGKLRDFDRSTWQFERDAEREAFALKRDAMIDMREQTRDLQEEATRLTRETQLDASRIARETELDASRIAREAQLESMQLAREARIDERMFSSKGEMFALSGAIAPMTIGDTFLTMPMITGKLGDMSGLVTPSRWLNSNWPDDPADSLYRQARELLNRGEWRRAATIFRDIPNKFPASAYAPDALYWQAFSLYRIGGSSELRDALTVLDAQRGKYPGARTQSDAAALATRIRGALASRGDAQAAAQISRTASDSTTRCDQEELAVRVEALSSLSQADPNGAAPIIQKVLARRDECSVQLRRSAVFLLASKRRDAAAISQLTQVARTDPSPEVRSAAIEWMSRIPGDEIVATLEDLAKSSDDERIQRAAVRGLMMNPTPRARAAVRTLIERNETPDRLRAEALGAFSGERATNEDVAWLRTLYGKSDSPRMQARIVAAVSRVGGAEVDQWLMTIARNADEDSEVRGIALRRVSRTLAIPDLAKLYDQSADRSSREMLIGAMSDRAEPEATDKLIDIVKTGTDPQLRRSAIGALTRKKDPRTTRLLMEIVDR